MESSKASMSQKEKLPEQPLPAAERQSPLDASNHDEDHLWQIALQKSACRIPKEFV